MRSISWNQPNNNAKLCVYLFLAAAICTASETHFVLIGEISRISLLLLLYSALLLLLVLFASDFSFLALIDNVTVVKHRLGFVPG